MSGIELSALKIICATITVIVILICVTVILVIQLRVKEERALRYEAAENADKIGKAYFSSKNK